MQTTKTCEVTGMRNPALLLTMLCASMVMSVSLWGCSGGVSVPPAGDPRPPKTEYPQHVYDLLAQLPDYSSYRQSSAKGTSAVLPLVFDATLEYDPVLEAGWAVKKHANTSKLGNARIQPQENLIGYVVYRVSSVTQPLGELLIECTPGYYGEYGLAVYDFCIDGWQPVFFGQAPDAGSPVTLQEDYLSGTNGFVLAAFAEYPNRVNIHRLTITEGDPAPPVTSWVHTWGGADHDDLRSVTVDSNGNVLAAGMTRSFGAGLDECLLMKYGPEGDPIWQKSYGGSQLDWCSAVEADESGNMYVVGSTFSFGAGREDVLFLKLSPDGNMIWQEVWGGESDERPWAMTLDDAGNIYIAGSTRSFGSNPVITSDFLLMKYDLLGNLQWQKTFGGLGSDVAHAVKLDASGNIYLAGNTDGSFGNTDHDVLLLKYSPAGDLLWQKKWDGGGDTDQAVTMELDGDGNIYLAGYTRNGGAGDMDCLLIKFNSAGGIQWETTWGGVAAENAEELAVGGNGDVYLIGKTSSFGAGSSDILLLKYSSDGNLLLEEVWGGAESEQGRAVCIDGSGVIHLAGYAQDATSSWQDVIGTTGLLTGSISDVSGTARDAAGTSSHPAGATKTSPAGTFDTGGGGNDSLVMKFER